MKAISILAVCLLAGCVATMPQQSARPTAKDDPTLKCLQGLQSENRFQILVPKIGSVSHGGQASIEMMASKGVPNDEERRALSIWAVARETCMDFGRSYRAQYSPPGWAAAFDEAQSLILQAIASLYGGNITYGQFIAERERIGNAAGARMEEANRRDMAARAQQAQQNQDRTNAAIQMLMLAQPRPAPMTPSIDCTSRVFGNIVRTNCD